jgi:excisionase family DNA binding protein
MTDNSITVLQAAKLAGKHPETIRRWIREGLLPAKKLGLVWFINPHDVLNRETASHVA